MRSLRLVAAAAALTLVLAACGSSSSPSSSTPAGSTPTGGSGGGGKAVAVTLKDFSITVAGNTSLAPGKYTFDVTNQGPSSHNLTITGPGVSGAATPTFASGSQTLSVTLKTGTYDLFCSVPGHQAAGMDAKITVG